MLNWFSDHQHLVCRRMRYSRRHFVVVAVDEFVDVVDVVDVVVVVVVVVAQ